ncbi:MAG: SMC-Scp complex subunit ScpB [Clostridiales bacterium]|nr:SMC-Scp complex subunit ScpB [Clostridiales bacterium]
MRIVEAILFSAGDSVPVGRLAIGAGCEEDKIREICEELRDQLDYERRGVRIIRIQDSYRMVSASEHAQSIYKALETRKPPSLTQTALEVLAIVAYKQPVTRAYIEQVRGVDSSYTVGSLVDKGLIREAGRLDVPGRPILYETTEEFLRVFDLSELHELPPLPELDEEAGDGD